MDERDAEDLIRVEEKSVERVEITSDGVEDTKVTRTKVSYSSEPKRYESDEEILRKRKEKFFKILKKTQWWVIILLIIAVILGAYIRSMPMHDHGGKPGLWDITTNTWTLGPDLDPWLFERYAEIIVEQGSLPARDYMRNVPLGFDTTVESTLLPYMIDWTYHFFNIFSDTSVIFAAAIFPVIMFVLTIIAFFLFVREVFVRKSLKSKLKANIIAIISTFFMIVIPVFMSRTIAGIPEKESAAFFFMFISYYFFLKAWKSENIKLSIVLGILAGITTGMMGLVWGGIIYMFIPMGAVGFIAFILNKVKKKEFLVYALWIILSYLVLILFSNKYSATDFFTSLSSGLAFFALLLMIIHGIVWKTKISQIGLIKNSRLPRTIVSLIVTVVVVIIFSLIFLGPLFISEKISAIHQTIFKPIQGRWNITVAENRQPNFKEWSQNFGPFIKNIPIMFWLFFLGSILLFRKMLAKLKRKDAWVLTGFYILFFLGLVFSRYSGDSVFNGDNFISKFFYYATFIIFVISIIYYYRKYYKAGDRSFEKIKIEYLFLLAVFIFTLFTARGAVRLIMVLGPIAVIFASFLIIETFGRFRKTKDETFKVIIGIILIIIIIGSLYCFFIYYQASKSQAYNFVPSGYNVQWQQTMEWVRTNTPKDAVFSHWWDYGYWVQSIGERATILDGGNAIAYWNYLMGRLVLTGDNQADALEFLYNHNATHHLIDSSDLGKYTAFSSIGSDINYDKYSWVGTFLLDESQTQETLNQTTLFYSGGVSLDEDLIIEQDGKEVFLPRQAAGVGAMLLPIDKSGELGNYRQPYAIMVYQNRQYKVDMRYLYVNNKIYDFQTGIDATLFVFPKLEVKDQGVGKNDHGAAIFVSPRLMRGMLSQIYLMNDPLNNFPNFKLVHTQNSLIVNDLKNQGMDLSEFIYYQGIQGPIKIWEIEYTGEEQVRQEYIDTDYTKYIDWQL
ncbi:MAG: STT3 domain-containing protein [archaeon]